jgi:hypothetical protein
MSESFQSKGCLSLKVFETPRYETETIAKFLEGQVRSEGIFKKKALESLEGFRIIHRPFRRVTWKIENSRTPEEKTSTSFIDEILSVNVSDSDHRFLLWRPHYTRLKILDSEKAGKSFSDGNIDEIQEVIDELISLRWKAQELDDDLRPKLRSLQADPLTAISLIVPRTPHGLKREQKLLADRNDIHSYILASSLVTNTSPKDIVTSAEVHERVFVETIVAEYRDLENGDMSNQFFETPGSKSLYDTKRSGKALTRIFQLYPECTKLFS